MTDGIPHKNEPHAITRARERFGIELTIPDLAEIARRIREGKSLLLSKSRKGGERHAITYAQTEMCVLYDPVSELVVTIVTLEGYRTAPVQYRARVQKQRTPGRARRARREKNKLHAMVKEYAP